MPITLIRSQYEVPRENLCVCVKRTMLNNQRKLQACSILWHIFWKQELWGWETLIARKRLCKMQQELSVRNCVFCTVRTETILMRTSCHYERLEMAIRRLGVRCEKAASPQGRDPKGRRTSTTGRHYQAAQLRPWLTTLDFVLVIEWFIECSHELFKSLINHITNPKAV